jgi:bifunctional DNA-binding transcriptional regulator/antitoxin component of YhaV-PrlF toxin-antitoxin module
MSRHRDESVVGFDDLYSTIPRVIQFAGIPFHYPTTSIETPVGVAHCATATIDQRGRVSDRSAIRKLDWNPGQPVTILHQDQLAILQPADDGRWAVGPTGYIHLPANIQHACGMAPGDRLLLVASLTHQRLVVYTTPLVAAAISQFRPNPWGPQ